MSGPTQGGQDPVQRPGGRRVPSGWSGESGTGDEAVQLGVRWWPDLWATVRSLGFSSEGNRSHGRALSGG